MTSFGGGLYDVRGSKPHPHVIFYEKSLKIGENEQFFALFCTFLCPFTYVKIVGLIPL